MRCLVFSICIHKNGLWSAKFNLLSDAASAKQRVLMKNGMGGSIGSSTKPKFRVIKLRDLSLTE